jgi:hypothetical protein
MSDQPNVTTNKALVEKFLGAFSESCFDEALDLMDN